MIRIIESPREGMQALLHVIPTADKVSYLNSLLRVGFDTVELGSIVSPRVMPQMADSLEVLRQLDLGGTVSNRMFLAVNRKGAEVLAATEEITHIAYPFSFSPTFLQHNVRSTVEEALSITEGIVELCGQSNKKAVIYISMAFGNPYGDPWNLELLVHWVGVLHDAGVRIIPLSNVATEIDAPLIRRVFGTLIPLYPDIEFGLHLHTANREWLPKVEAAYSKGCRRFDGVINGWGGCPMSGKELLGNLATENLLSFAEDKGIPLAIDRDILLQSYEIAAKIFYH
jgi:hydroxymethylglutaryl-CoA lyase